MLILQPDLEEPYVPFVTSRHSAVRLHEVRRREPRAGRSRRALGKALVRAGLVVAGVHSASDR
jgi:hypothetical protein